MVVDMEELILKRSDEKELAKIKQLSLSDCGLEVLDSKVFQQMTLLEVLDLSDNQLHDVPYDLEIPQLLKLDVSNNFLSDAEFVVQFPNLLELDIDGNDLESSDRYIAVSLCSSLTRVDNLMSDHIEKMKHNMRERLMPQISGIWEGQFASKYRNGIEESEVDEVSEKFIEICKSTEMIGPTTLKKYTYHMVEVLAQELVQRVIDKEYEPPAKRARAISNYRNMVSPGRENASPVNKKNAMVPTTQLQKAKDRTPLAMSSPQNGVAPKSADKKTLNKSMPTSRMPVSGKKSPPPPSKSSAKKSTTSRYTHLREQNDLTSLPGCPEYDPLHMLRCHSGGSKDHEDNDPTDNKTKVWKCAFEPDPKKPGEYLGIVASCGGNMVCLIDCQSGKVMKRFRKEDQEFYTLAWTTVTMENEKRSWPTNLLAVGGLNGHIMLIHPEQLVCYEEFDVSNRRNTHYIGCMNFHPEQPTILFCGDTNGLVTVWDIGIPTGPHYKTKCQLLQTLKTPRSGMDVLNVEICLKTSHLIGACEGGLFAWKLNTTKWNQTQKETSKQLVLPVEAQDMDALCLLGNDLIASKPMTEGVIHIWQLSSTLQGDDSEVHVQPIATLEWRKTDQTYMNMDAKKGILVCGDDVGCLWVYNLEPIINNPNTICTNTLPPSQTLDWPQCQVTSPRDLDQLMIDVKEQPELLVVNYVAIGQDAKFVVATTDINLVGIWQC